MEALIEEILTKLSALPEPKLREVLHFVDQIKPIKSTFPPTDPSEDPLLAIAGILTSDPLSATAIESELYDHSQS